MSSTIQKDKGFASFCLEADRKNAKLPCFSLSDADSYKGAHALMTKALFGEDSECPVLCWPS